MFFLNLLSFEGNSSLIGFFYLNEILRSLQFTTIYAPTVTQPSHVTLDSDPSHVEDGHP